MTPLKHPSIETHVHPPAPWLIGQRVTGLRHDLPEEQICSGLVNAAKRIARAQHSPRQPGSLTVRSLSGRYNSIVSGLIMLRK